MLLEIEPQHFAMVCMLYAMQHERKQPLLTSNEVKACILMHLRLKNDDTEEFEAEIFVPKPRPTQIMTFYKDRIFELANDTVGYILPKTYFQSKKGKDFDRKIFHCILDKLENETFEVSEVKEADLEEMEYFFNIVTSNGDRVL